MEGEYTIAFCKHWRAWGLFLTIKGWFLRNREYATFCIPDYQLIITWWNHIYLLYKKPFKIWLQNNCPVITVKAAVTTQLYCNAKRILIISLNFIYKNQSGELWQWSTQLGIFPLSGNTWKKSCATTCKAYQPQKTNFSLITFIITKRYFVLFFIIIVQNTVRKYLIFWSLQNDLKYKRRSHFLWLVFYLLNAVIHFTHWFVQLHPVFHYTSLTWGPTLLMWFLSKILSFMRTGLMKILLLPL